MAWVDLPDLSKGLNADATGEELELGHHTATQNMRFRNGYAERFRGMESVYTAPSVTPYCITHYRAGNSRFVVWPGLAKTFADDGTTQTEITNADNTGAIDDRWSGFVFNGIYVQNNGVDVPQYWNGDTGTNLANLTAWPAGYKAGFMRAYGNFLIIGDVTRAGVRERSTLVWSHSADPGAIPTSWDIADATKDAGDISLAETNGTLIDSLPLGNMNVVYKDDSVFYQQPVQSSAIFRFGRLPGDTGLLARGCVAAVPGGEHVLLTAGLDLVRFNGQAMVSVLEGRLRTWLANNINSTNAIRSFVVANPNTTEVLLCFPSGSSATCDKAIVWNWREDKVYTRDLPNVTYGSAGQVTLSDGTVWSSATGTWTTATEDWTSYGDISGIQRLIFARASRLSRFDSTELDHGSSFNASLTRTGMHFGAPQRNKWVRAIRPRIDATNGTVVKLQVGTTMVPNGTVTWGTASDFTVGTDVEVFTDAPAGRYVALKEYTTGDTFWRTRAGQIDVVDVGGY